MLKESASDAYMFANVLSFDSETRVMYSSIQRQLKTEANHYLTLRLSLSAAQAFAFRRLASTLIFAPH
jgi:hypothetical protein